MTELTKGNYKTRRKARVKKKDEEEGFEKAVLENLDGSTAFVLGDKFIDTNE